MSLISNESQLIKNIRTVDNYLSDGSPDEQTAIRKYIKRGTCFVAYQTNEEIRFAPSKFIGYINNTLKKHIPGERDGRDTNREINRILHSQPLENNTLELEYLKYCNNLGFQPNEKGGRGRTRKFWMINLKVDFDENSTSTDEFAEGKIVERLHKARERNPQVIRIAKDNFRKKHGRLFCQVCEFDFEKVYGKIGADFIEGHHLIPISSMEPNHKTKAEDIALLCANCHRIIHKQMPWLTIEELKKSISKIHI